MRLIDADSLIEELGRKVEELFDDDGCITYEGGIHKDGIITGIYIAIKLIKEVD